MGIEIRRLTPEMAEDYVSFFDVTPHNVNMGGGKCYCVTWRQRRFLYRQRRPLVPHAGRKAGARPWLCWLRQLAGISCLRWRQARGVVQCQWGM